MSSPGIPESLREGNTVRVTVDNAADIGGSGGLTDAELRATAVPVSAASLPLPTGAATAANQQTDALTDTELRATAVPVSAASLPLPTGAATSAAQATLETDVEGTNTRLGEVQASPTANTVLDRLKALLTELQLKADLSETQPVSLASVPSHAVTNAGTFAVQNTAATPAGTNNIGDVDVASIAAGDNNIGNVDVASIAAGDNNIGNVDIASALPAGTNAIGKLAANSGVDIGDVDVTSLPALAAGTNYIGKVSPPDVDVTTHTNYAKKYYTNAGAVTDGIVWSPAAGKRWHVVTMYIQVSAAATVTLEDDLGAGDSAVWKSELAANSGVVVPWGEKYPLASGEDAADLLITTSAGNVYVSVVGYEV